MRVLFFQDRETLNRYWPEVAPLFESVVSRASEGEFTAADIYDMAARGTAIIGVATEAGKVILAVAFEFRYYRRKTAVNILALAGRAFKKVMGEFSGRFETWCKSAGADWIEASCSPAMERMLERTNGFRQAYRLVRKDLQKEG